MNMLNITVGSTTVTMRLSARKLQDYIKKCCNNASSPLLAIMDAVDSLENQAELFTAALNHKGNLNAVKDGYELLDMMADANYTPVQRKKLVIDLAEYSGMIEENDGDTLRSALDRGERKFIDTVATVLAGENPKDKDEHSQDIQAETENPT